MQLLRQRIQSDSESSVVSARNDSVMAPKLSMNCEMHCTLWENEPTSDAVDSLGECSWFKHDFIQKKDIHDTK